MNDHRTESSELKLERLISGVVAGLPTRRAPLTLEGRVLAAISEGNTPLARAQGFASWPAPLRWLAFPALTAVAAGLMLMVGGAGGVHGGSGACTRPRRVDRALGRATGDGGGGWWRDGPVGELAAWILVVCGAGGLGLLVCRRGRTGFCRLPAFANARLRR